MSTLKEIKIQLRKEKERRKERKRKKWTGGMKNIIKLL